MTQIGQAAPQIQQTVISNSPQQNAQKLVDREAQGKSSNAVTAQANAQGNYVKLAQDIISARASGEATQLQPQRGQVVNLLV